MDQYFQSEPHTYFSSTFWSPLSQLLTGTLKWCQPLDSYFHRDSGSNHFISNLVYMVQYFQRDPHTYFSTTFWSPLSSLLTGTLKWHQPLAFYFYRDCGSNHLTSYSVYMDQYFQNEPHTYFSFAFWSSLSQLLTGNIKWHLPLVFYFYRDYGSNHLTSIYVYLDQYLRVSPYLF